VKNKIFRRDDPTSLLRHFYPSRLGPITIIDVSKAITHHPYFDGLFFHTFMVKLGMVTIALPTLLHHQKLEGCNEFLFYSSYFKIQSLKHLQTAGVAMPVGTFTKWVFKKHSFLRDITFLKKHDFKKHTLCKWGCTPTGTGL